MATAISSLDRLSAALRPAGRAVGYHRWSDLLFVHWRVPVEVIEPLVPRNLSLDTWEGDAWVGLVPFHMSNVRPHWSPAMPGLSTFHETNVRTYVHQAGRDPGVYFLSLEAANLVAVLIARRAWCLNYHWARMDIRRTGRRLHYTSSRRWPGPVGAATAIDAEIGRPLTCGDGRDATGTCAVPGTLEHFLIERYLLYTQSRDGRLLQGQVHHSPYRLFEARLLHLEESLLSAHGIHPSAPPCHVVYSPAVSVEVFPLRAIQ